jgi:phosphate starvation-inducible PhoH-like protein
VLVSIPRISLNSLNTDLKTLELSLEPDDNKRLANMCGQFDEHLRQLERRLGVEVNNRGNHFQLIGDEAPVEAAGTILKQLYTLAEKGPLSSEQVHLQLREVDGAESTDVDNSHTDTDSDVEAGEVGISTRHGLIRGRGANQRRYLKNIVHHDLNFGIGPAGTGKTYLAVACAVEALQNEHVSRIVLVRPAVEAGERLGFLPGDMAQKIDPYLRPLYDALYEMLGVERVNKLIERNVIEVAPLAFMRGRTLNDSFIILDEAQNTTIEQMKMFLTRIGFNSTAVVTGDVTQIDLPDNRKSGLRHVMVVLKDVDGISFTIFNARDVVRHPLVQRIVSAYDAHETRHEEEGG